MIQCIISIHSSWFYTAMIITSHRRKLWKKKKKYYFLEILQTKETCSIPTNSVSDLAQELQNFLLVPIIQIKSIYAIS